MALLLFSAKLNKNSISYCRSPILSLYQRYFATDIQQNENQSKYPPILDLSKKAVEEREKIAWHEEVKRLDTIEEKLIKVNMPYYYGLRTTPLQNDEYHYNCLPYFQHWTRTQYESGLPNSWFKQSTEEITGLVNAVKDEIIEAIRFHSTGIRREYDCDPKLGTEEKERRRTTEICKDLNRILLKNLSSKASHLIESEVDIEPRHEAFWFCGGIEPPTDKKIWIERKVPLTEEEKNEPIDRPFQYIGKPILSIRNRLPLESVIDDFNDHSFDVEVVPRHRTDPQGIGYQRVYQHVTSIPGFWPGSEHEFGQLCYHNRLKYKVPFNEHDAEDETNALKAQGILTSFGWLVAQACYQGFSTFNDLTYPLTTQTIITDGKRFTFFLYQLNTTVFETVNFDKNRRVNKCWSTDELELFEGVDSDGNVIGFNDEVLRHLIQFYLTTPKERNCELKPYLAKEEETVADIDHLERREFLETRFKHLFSKRPRHRKDLIPEVYLWEWIYKIKFNTMPIEPRRRFFELNQDPWKRRLDEHTPPYIPKELRPDGPKSKKKWATTYWP